MLQWVIGQCGYHPERIDSALCDDLYQQVYLACREDGFDNMSMTAHAWVLIFDPGGPLIAGLRRACSAPAPVSREAFGQQLCGD
jgi:hypothetical protein